MIASYNGGNKMSCAGTARLIRCCLGILLCTCVQSTAQTGKRLWVLTPPDEAIEYSPGDFSPKQKIKIPAEAVKNPERFAINAKGQMLFVPDLIRIQPATAQSIPTDRVWVWNGQSASLFDRGATTKASPAGGNISTLESTPQWALSADGQRFYWFANVFKILKTKDGGDESVETRFAAWQMDPVSMKLEQIAESAFPPCKCETGVCSETCPEAEYWWPDSGLSDFFTVTHKIQGQVSTTIQGSYLYRKSAGKWSGTKLPIILERMLDGTRGGEILVHAIPDGGCCGWDNESNDQTLLARGGKSTVLFDERRKYANSDYDVSFFTSNALLSPDASFVAMTINSSFEPGMELRLSDGGKPDTAQLERIRRSLKECPSVEILKIQDPPKSIVQIPHASLAGWLDDKEILIVEDHELVVYDTVTGIRRKSHISIPKETLVFLR